MRTVVVCVCALLVSGCQNFYQEHVFGNENTPYFKVPVGSKFTLKRELSVPAKSDSVYFQQQEIRLWYNVNIWLAYCVLKTHTKKDVPQTIKPDTFVVQKVYWDWYYQLALAPIQVAQMDRDGGIMEYRVVTMVMELFSESQPDVVKLICGQWDFDPDMPHMSIRIMRHELKDVFSLEVALKQDTLVQPRRRQTQGSEY
ncbi:MAG: hypothetical protein ACE5K1_02390 [Acidiferrobacterales bacterium]